MALSAYEQLKIKKNRAEEYVSNVRTFRETIRIHAGAFAEAEVLQDCNRAH